MANHVRISVDFLRYLLQHCAATRERRPGVWLALAVVTACNAAVSQGFRQEVRMPPTVDGFRLADSTELGGEAGKSFRYADSSGILVDVYLYPVETPGSAVRAPSRLDSEGSAFLNSLAEAQVRGWYADYRVIIDTVRTFRSADGEVQGRVVVFVFQTGEDAFVSFAHLFVLDDYYLKVRLTLPSSTWEHSQAPNFAQHLIGQVRTREKPG